jgi:hypothetical protein
MEANPKTRNDTQVLIAPARRHDTPADAMYLGSETQDENQRGTTQS